MVSPIPSRDAESSGAEASPLPRISLVEALRFPFTQPNWPQALAYIGAIQFIPILGYLVIRGWRFDIARRVGSDHVERMPDWRHFREHLKQGLILFGATQFYYVPLYVFLWLQRHAVYYALAEIVVWLYEKWWQGLDDAPRSDVLWGGGIALGWIITALIVYPFFASPVIESATQRYAHTGRVRTLLEFWWNVLLVFDDFLDVLRIELSILALSAAVAITSLLMAWTVGLSIFIPPVMIPIYMWTRGALMGQWIRKNRLEEVRDQGFIQ